MASSENPQDASKQRVDAVKALPPEVFEVWKYYEDRADRLGERLWAVGIWLVAIVGATISLPFLGVLIKPQAAYPYLHIENRVAVALLAVFGILLCLYSYFALRDLRDHIESNWRQAGYVLEGSWKSDWSGRKNHGWTVLLCIGALAFIAFAGILLLALPRGQA